VRRVTSLRRMLLQNPFVRTTAGMGFQGGRRALKKNGREGGMKVLIPKEKKRSGEIGKPKALPRKEEGLLLGDLQGSQ